MLRRLGAVACLLAFFACGRGDGERAADTRSPQVPTPAPTPCSVADGSTDTQRSDTTPPSAPLTDLRYSNDDCPRIVFEFEDDQPGYVVEYVSPPFTECGSGEEIPTEDWDASAYLSVRLEPSGSADMTDPEARQTYRGGRDLAVRGRIIKHLKVVCDFEAVFEWLVGLDGRRDFRVFTLDDPSRIVIDISEST